MMTWKQGLWRQPFHLGGWAIPAHLVAYHVNAIHAPAWIAYLLAAWISLFIGFYSWLAEMTEYDDRKQDKIKTILDLIFKLGGLALGLATMHWWGG